MSGVSKRRRWGRTAGCGCGAEDLCGADIRLNGNYRSVKVGEELTVSSSQSKDCDLSCSIQLVRCPPLSQCLGVVATLS